MTQGLDLHCQELSSPTAPADPPWASSALRLALSYGGTQWLPATHWEPQWSECLFSAMLVRVSGLISSERPRAACPCLAQSRGCGICSLTRPGSRAQPGSQGGLRPPLLRPPHPQPPGLRGRFDSIKTETARMMPGGQKRQMEAVSGRPCFSWWKSSRPEQISKLLIWLDGERETKHRSSKWAGRGGSSALFINGKCD